MTTAPFGRMSLWVGLVLAACAPGPTVYLGDLPTVDAGADATLPPDRDSAQEEDEEEAQEDDHGDSPGSGSGGEGGDGEGEHQNEGEEDEDLVFCLKASDCAEHEDLPRCNTERFVCVACLSDRDCPAEFQCDVAEGECERE